MDLGGKAREKTCKQQNLDHTSYSDRLGSSPGLLHGGRPRETKKTKTRNRYPQRRLLPSPDLKVERGDGR